MAHHAHDQEINNYNRSFALGIGLNVLFVGIEAGYGLYAESLALLADAGHNLSDVLSLLLAWGAILLAGKAATEKRTYGFRKVTIMASLVNAVLLLVVLGGITWEAISRFFHPSPADGMVIIVVAGIGVVINALTALLFVSGQKHDLNIRGAFIHMAADAGVSLGVVLAGILITNTGWLWVDPVTSLAIAGVILIGTWGLLTESMNAALDTVPKGIDISGIRSYLSGLEKVTRIHDLHVWPLSTTEVALTAHLVVIAPALDNDFLITVQNHLHDHFNIEHCTIQVEQEDDTASCLLDRKSCT